jgi:hypothetical protein
MMTSWDFQVPGDRFTDKDDTDPGETKEPSVDVATHK